MGMPRGKRWLYDTGTHIPILMRWPGRLDAGTVREDLVSVLDLPPTMLAVAEVEVPRSLHGRVLIGDLTGAEPSYLFFHRDRMDEVYDLQRGARDRRWKYIRNFQPEKPYAQHLDYMDRMPSMIDWRRFAADGKLSGGQTNWFAAEKPIEELYDTASDPWELENLAGRAQYRERLDRMRQATEQWQQQIGDLGMIPEAVMMEEMKPGGVTPQTEPPKIEIDGDTVSLSSPTEGASLVYQIRESDGWGPWQLYTKSFVLPADARAAARVRAVACRLGFTDSPIRERARFSVEDLRRPGRSDP